MDYAQDGALTFLRIPDDTFFCIFFSAHTPLLDLGLSYKFSRFDGPLINC